MKNDKNEGEQNEKVTVDRKITQEMKRIEPYLLPPPYVASPPVKQLAGKRPLKEVGENRNSKEQETMRKPTWRKVRAWENKGTCKNFLTSSSAAGDAAESEGGDENEEAWGRVWPSGLRKE